MLRQAIENARLMYTAQTADDPIVQMVQKFAQALFDYAETTIRFSDRRPSAILPVQARQQGKDAKQQWNSVREHVRSICATPATTDQGAEGPATQKRTVAACTQCYGSRWALQQTPDPARLGRDEIGRGAGIARSVIPRVRPPVCCVQYTGPGGDIAAIPPCIP